MDAVELVPTSSVGPLDASDGSRPGNEQRLHFTARSEHLL